MGQTERFLQRIIMDHFYKTIFGYFDYETLLVEVISKAPHEAHFLELGAFLGKSACFAGVEIINSGKKIKYDVVDHFLGSKNDPAGNNCKDECVKNIVPVNSVVTLVNLPSIEAAKLYNDNSLDFIFLDGDHNYKGIKSDLIAWYPKLKSGGTFAGHDHEPAFPGVPLAVKEFFTEKNVPYQTSTAPNIWKMIKP
jgi:hypothetical protein